MLEFLGTGRLETIQGYALILGKLTAGNEINKLRWRIGQARKVIPIRNFQLNRSSNPQVDLTIK